jgi:translation initiation factor IF-3
LTAAEQVALDDVKHDPRFTTAASVERSGRSRLPRDHEITDPQIMVHEKEMIEGPLRTQFVLTKIEPYESLRMVTPYVPATKEEPQKFAVCRIVNKKDEVAKEKRSREGKQKVIKVKEKTIEVNWGIDTNDLRTKFIAMKKLFDGPAKVTVRFGKKKGSKAKPDYNDQKALVQKVIEEVIKMGGREMRPMEGAFEQGPVSLLFASKHVAN